MANENSDNTSSTSATPSSRPNIILILADDLGFSDIGCFGSEIHTPNIDSLAYTNGGVRFTQMYNMARCCPSRASLLTGAYPHQAGIGHMVYDAGVGPAYQGYLRKGVETIGEMLKREYNHHPSPSALNSKKDGHQGNSNSADEKVMDKEVCGGGGYATCMVGKWHVGGEYPPDATHEWVQSTMGDETHPTPNQRGFDEFWGTLGGGGSYYQPPSLVDNEEVVTDIMPDGFYYTDAINDKACDFIEKVSRNEETEKPFFLYVSHVAPHWPLHAPKDEIDKYRGKYMHGWDKVRKERHSKLIQQQIIPPTWKCSPRDEHSKPWEEVEEKEWEDARMATYAAQITIMDEGIGRILETLRKTKKYENTVIFFLSDNGGCAEYLKENGEEGNWPEFYGGKTRDGKEQIQVGNLKNLEPGGEHTFMSYGLPWANTSNSPFRLFKSFVHEGGISTPFVVHWPAKLSASKHNNAINDKENNGNDNGRICHSPWVLMDIVATCCCLAGVPVPEHLEGESFLPNILGNNCTTRSAPIFFEHQGNRAVRQDEWKLVYRREDHTGGQQNPVDVNGWELYNMENDRTELHNLASKNEDLVKRLALSWVQWASRVGVKPWPLHPIPDGEKDWSNLPWMW